MRFACRSASTRFPSDLPLESNRSVIGAAFGRDRLSIIVWACAEHPSIVRPSSCAISALVRMVCVHRNRNRFFSLGVHGAGLTLSVSPGATIIFSFFLCQDDPSAVIRRRVYPVVRRDLAVCSCGNPTKRFDFEGHLFVIHPPANGRWRHMHHLGEGVCADAVLAQIIGEFHSRIVPACMSLRQ